MIYIGDGAIGYNSISGDSTGNILRFLQSDRHTPRVENGLEHSLATRKTMLIQLDSYGDGSNRGWHNDQNLINFTEATIAYIITKASAHGISHSQLRKFCRFTFDNEADEIYSPQEYGHYLDVFSDQVAGRFEIGAGNFNGHRTDYYNYILQNHNFRWLDFHMQKDFETVSKVNANISYYHNKAIQYGKKLACTEANPTSNNIWTSDGYSLFHHQLVKAKEIGCKGFYFVFIHQPMDNAHKNISFIRNNGEVNPHWSSFKQIIKDNKPVNIIPPVTEDEDMKLELLRNGSKGNQVKWLQKILLRDYGVPNPGGIDGSFGNLTEQQVRDYQEEKEITIDGIVGLETTTKLLEESSDPKKWMRLLQILMAYK